MQLPWFKPFGGRPLGAMLLACSLILPLQARGDEGRSHIHAVIGQPLSIQVPVEFSSSHPGSIDVSVEAIAGVPDAERDAAESVVASYDRLDSQVHLTTPERVTVPLMRLRLKVAGAALSITQEIDVLVDLPDFDRQFDRPGAAAATAGSAGAPASGITVLETHHHVPEARLFGDSAAADGKEDAAGHPAAMPAEPVAEAAARPLRQPVPMPSKRLREQSPAAGAQPVAAAPLPPEPLPPGGAGLLSLGFDALKAELESGLRSTSLRAPDQADNRVREIVAAAAAMPLAVVLAGAMLRRSSRRGYARPLHAADHRAERQAAAKPPGAEVGELARLRRMLDDNPQRSDIRYQFVQRLYKARDTASFAEAALPLKSVASEEIWRRVRSMAEELLPGDARFA